MKTLVATVALAAVIASPAFAQTATRRAPAVQQYPSQYDQPYGRAEGTPRASNQANSVYENGQYLGADPDPNVRLELRRDYEHRDF